MSREEAGGSPGQLSLSSFSSLFSVSSATSTPTPHLPPLPSLSLSIGGGGNDEQPPLSSSSAVNQEEDEQRSVRMMKNRESALRSRARKRAYVQELEKEVSRLVDHNLKLKRQCKQLKTEMAALVQAQQQPSKSPQYRRTPSSSTHL
ncbi:ABSCISIC ACID-INSENSITIVE 5-like protein 2 [Brachypodium distachyon]|uniref:BZIP domain-containing protein n=1 Tax=Brachypodium distachyon TaxID=15368 RepID=I1IFV0_BRADI|nr:ABSCISIC ACID-INSENSITIVE 5-like protein 2 [Brachypodium distachyon]KQK02190.1 hypothetical protein BRADI_3g60870v3 [Brachypodium distachyon]|eukprot:XP_003570743.1 ABSCISIC ACID-INSENSITIVE 5-like protein 2 [Brachypodium distachyon]